MSTWVCGCRRTQRQGVGLGAGSQRRPPSVMWGRGGSRCLRRGSQVRSRQRAGRGPGRRPPPPHRARPLCARCRVRPLSRLLGSGAEPLPPVAFADSLILESGELAGQPKMTRKKEHQVPRSSNGLVNLGLDMGDDMVLGLSYVSRSPLYQTPWKRSWQGVLSAQNLGEGVMSRIYSTLIFLTDPRLL